MNVVHMFWIGDKEKVSDRVNVLEAQGLKVNLGPSAEEDAFLTKNVKYYRLAKERKIFSFCSDVWRYYTLSKKPGIYIDALEVIGKNFYEYFNDFKKYNIVLTRNSLNSVGGDFIYSDGTKKDVFQECFDLFKSFDYDDPRLFVIGPDIITWVMRRYYSPGYDFEVNDGVAIISLLETRRRDRYFKQGNASWTSGFDPVKYSQKAEDMFRKRNKKVPENLSRYALCSIFPRIGIGGLRDAYDSAITISELKKLKKLYKQIPYKLSWKERLIWSKLYRFFTGKFLCHIKRLWNKNV